MMKHWLDIYDIFAVQQELPAMNENHVFHLLGEKMLFQILPVKQRFRRGNEP